MSTTENLTTKVVTGKVRLSYFKAWEADEQGRYTTAILIPKMVTINGKSVPNPDIAKIEKAIQAAIVAGKSKLADKNGKVPTRIKTPLRDGDEEKPDDEAYVGNMFLNAATYNRPGIVDRNKNQIIDKNDLGSGDYALVSLNFYAFNKADTNKGIAAGLGNIMKVADGERFGGGATAEQDFAGVEIEEEDFLS